MSLYFNELFAPINIGGTTIKNRYVMEPMATFGLVDDQGIITDEGIEYFVARARGGCGLIITGTCFVDDTVEKIKPHTLMCTEKTDRWKLMQQTNKMVKKIHAYGGKIFLQLAAGYGRSARIPSSAGEAVAPSPIPNRWNQSIIHREITVEEIERITSAFGKAAAFFKKCGVDGVEVHAVHEGYLLDQFTVPIFNQRTDEYGGSFENRYRFAMNICSEIKKACGMSFPVSLRYSLTHCIKGLLDGAVEDEPYIEAGRNEEEGIKAAKYLTQPGFYDALNVDIGCYDAHYWNHPSAFQKDGLYLKASELVKQNVSVPVICAGRMDNPYDGADAIQNNLCDMIGLARPILADPDLPNKVAQNKIREIRPCISCNFGCSTNVHANSGHAGCAVNAQCAYETSTQIFPAAVKKRIVVIGAGPAGCEAARVAALRGHEVIVIEKNSRLGGAFISASTPGFKHHAREYLIYLRNELDRLGVKVKYNTVCTVKLVSSYDPDIVICATGSKARSLDIPGAEYALQATDVLMDLNNAPRDVIIQGTGLVGVELGIELLKRWHSVTILGRSTRFMANSLYSDSEHALALIKYYGGELLFNSSICNITPDSVVVQTPDGERKYYGYSAVLATGFDSDSSVYSMMSEAFPIVYNIGDSVSPRNIYYAVHEAFELANNV